MKVNQKMDTIKLAKERFDVSFSSLKKSRADMHARDDIEGARYQLNEAIYNLLKEVGLEVGDPHNKNGFDVPPKGKKTFVGSIYIR